MNYEKSIDKAISRLKNYECDGQMSIFDVDWESLQKKEPVESVKDELVEEDELDLPF